VAVGQGFLRVLRFSSVTTIPPLLHIHSCIIWGTDNGPVSGRSSTDTQSHPVATVTTRKSGSRMMKVLNFVVHHSLPYKVTVVCFGFCDNNVCVLRKGGGGDNAHDLQISQMHSVHQIADRLQSGLGPIYKSYFLDFVHRLYFNKNLKFTTFRKLNLLPSSGPSRSEASSTRGPNS
jgi:hypothetical protein